MRGWVEGEEHALPLLTPGDLVQPPQDHLMAAVHPSKVPVVSTGRRTPCTEAMVVCTCMGRQKFGLVEIGLPGSAADRQSS